MSVDQPPRDERMEQLLQEVHKTLQENQRFLEALKQDREVEDQLDAELDDGGAVVEEFEEL